MGINLYRNLSCGRFFAVPALAAVLALAFAGCDILAKLGFGEEEGGGGTEATVTTAAFTGIEQVEGNATTTTLVLVFDRDVPGLKKEHVTVSPAIPQGSEKPDGLDNPASSENAESPVISGTDALQAVAVLNIGKTDDRPGVYTLALAGIETLEKSLWPVDSFSGKLDVTVAADDIPGYRIASSSYRTDIYVVPPRREVRFSDTGTGGEANRKTTAWITFRLNPEAGGSLNGLEQGNVLLSVPGDANKNIATDGIPENIDGLWKVPVTGIDAEGTVTVTLARDGYRFNPASVEDVPVHYARPVTLVSAAAADGDELLAQPTTQITLTFDGAVDGLALNDITVTANKTGAKPVSITPVSGNKYTLTLEQGSVTASGSVEVTVAKDGYDVTNGAVQVAVYDNKFNHLATGGTVTVTKESNVYYETHIFTSTAANQSLAFKSTPNLTAQVLVVGGGGGGGKSGGADWRAGGGGGGAVLTHPSYALTSSSYSVTVGGGGAAATSATSSKGSLGGDSTFGSDFTAKGGGGGGSHASHNANTGSAGGSGGGGGSANGGGVVESTVPAGGVASGNSGANSVGLQFSGGGGGGAGGAGVAPTSTYAGTKGGDGIFSDITGSSVYYGGGGTSGSNVTQEDSRGAYGGNAGAANTGDGGCGGGGSSTLLSGSAGGSGIVVVRFKVPSAQ
jgi:hypothetical protein